MTIHFRSFVSALTVSALLLFSFFQPSVRAQPVNDIINWTFIESFAPGQKLRLDFAVDGTSNTAPSGKLYVQFALFNAAGEPIRQSVPVPLPPVGFVSIDVDRSELSDPGDPLTRSLRVLGKATIVDEQGRVVDGLSNTIAIGEWSPEVSVQIIDTSTGRSTVLMPAIQKIRDDARPRHFGAFGFARGQSAVFTVYNPLAPGQRVEGFRFDLMGHHGEILAQSAEITIPPGRFGSVVFNWEELIGAAEPDGRVEVRPTYIQRISAFPSATLDGDAMFTLEVIDQATGRVTLYVRKIGWGDCSTCE
jgi:hypothetical protein